MYPNDISCLKSSSDKQKYTNWHLVQEWIKNDSWEVSFSCLLQVNSNTEPMLRSNSTCNEQPHGFESKEACLKIL